MVHNHPLTLPLQFLFTRTWNKKKKVLTSCIPSLFSRWIKKVQFFFIKLPFYSCYYVTKTCYFLLYPQPKVFFSCFLSFFVKIYTINPKIYILKLLIFCQTINIRYFLHINWYFRWKFTLLNMGFTLILNSTNKY